MSAKPRNDDSREHEQQDHEWLSGPESDMSTRAPPHDGEEDRPTTSESTDRYDGPTSGSARFLLVAPADTEIRDLGDLWERWESTGEPEQAELSRWSA
jgi:hypothetical protein